MATRACRRLRAAPGVQYRLPSEICGRRYQVSRILMARRTGRPAWLRRPERDSPGRLCASRRTDHVHGTTRHLETARAGSSPLHHIGAFRPLRRLVYRGGVSRVSLPWHGSTTSGQYQPARVVPHSYAVDLLPRRGTRPVHAGVACVHRRRSPTRTLLHGGDRGGPRIEPAGRIARRHRIRLDHWNPSVHHARDSASPPSDRVSRTRNRCLLRLLFPVSTSPSKTA